MKRFAPGSIVGTVARGALAAARRDIIDPMKLLIDAEMRMFAGLKTGVIFLQNVVTDLLLGLGLQSIFVAFAEHVRRKYNAEPGFITMNLPRLVDSLEECGIANPIICSSINLIGFRMCGGREAYERVIREKCFRPIAMSILASGAVPPAEAVEYVCRQPGIRSIVFGASTRAHIKQTVELISHYS